MDLLELEGFEDPVINSSEGSVGTDESYKSCKRALKYVYFGKLSRDGCVIEHKKNYLIVNTVTSKTYDEIKFKKDVLIYSSSKPPPTRFKIIFGYNAPTVLELVQSISLIQEEKKAAPENSEEDLPYVIVFNGCDLSDQGSIENYANNVINLLAVIWCDPNYHPSLQLAYNNDQIQKLKDKIEEDEKKKILF